MEEKIMKKELERLSKINDLLEDNSNKESGSNLVLYETIEKNTSTMCKIAEVLLKNA